MQAPPSRPRPPGAARCRGCGATLSPVEARAGWCAAPACARRRDQEAARVAAARQRGAEAEALARVAPRAAGRVAAALAQAGLGAEAVVEGRVGFAVVPRQDRALSPPAPERRAAMAAHLDACLEAARELPAPEPAAIADHVDPEPPAGDAICGACRGWCCVAGKKEMAFLGPEDMARARAFLGAETEAEVKRAYLERMPELSAENACLFQGALGCTLPREMRAEICNRFVCDRRRQADAAAEGREALAIVATGTTGAAMRVSVWRRGAGEGAAARPADPAKLAPALAAAGRAALARDGAAAPAPPTVCRFCGGALTVHEAAAGGVCGRPPCRAERLREAAARVAGRGEG